MEKFTKFKKTQNAFQSAKFNTIASTYFQKIILSNGVILKGYSQKSGFAEKTDKDDLLINFILRMYQSGYFDKDNVGTKKQLEQIEYYLNDSFEPIHILNLYYDTFELIRTDFELSPKVMRFLTRFYEVKKDSRKSKVLDELYQKQKQTIDIFDLSKKRFITKKSLVEYCYLMIDQKKCTKAEAEHFYQKYLLKFNI